MSVMTLYDIAEQTARAAKTILRPDIKIEVSHDLDQMDVAGVDEYIGLHISNPDYYDMVIYRIADKIFSRPTIAGDRHTQVRNYAVDVLTPIDSDLWSAPEWKRFGTCNGRSVYQILDYIVIYLLSQLE